MSYLLFFNVGKILIISLLLLYNSHLEIGIITIGETSVAE